jgi:hypothetical protein
MILSLLYEASEVISMNKPATSYPVKFNSHHKILGKKLVKQYQGEITHSSYSFMTSALDLGQ